MDARPLFGNGKEPQAKSGSNAQTWGRFPAWREPRAEQAGQCKAIFGHAAFGIKRSIRHGRLPHSGGPVDPLQQSGCGKSAPCFGHANAWAVIAEWRWAGRERVEICYSQLFLDECAGKAGVVL